jgi:hypothetical protein
MTQGVQLVSTRTFSYDTAEQSRCTERRDGGSVSSWTPLARRRWSATLDASSVKATIPILLLIALVAGCQSALDVYESKAALTAVVSTNTNGALSLAWRHLPSEVMLVTGAVQRVELPLVNSPSLAGDKASC